MTVYYKITQIFWWYQDEGSQHLTESTRAAIKRLGSVDIEHLTWRDAWLFVVQKAGRTYYEQIKHSNTPYTWPAPLTKSLTIPLLSPESSECRWPDKPENRRRKVFCNLYEGYGQLCNCKYVKYCLQMTFFIFKVTIYIAYFFII